jgi:hypothetical protein
MASMPCIALMTCLQGGGGHEGDRASSGKGDGGGGAGLTHEGGGVARGRDEGIGGDVMIHMKAAAASGVGGETKDEKQLRIWDTERRENTDGRGRGCPEQF